jgi:hypothetical protein
MGIPSQPPILTFAYPQGRPQFIDPNGGTNFRVEIGSGTANPKPGTGYLYYNSGGGWSNVPMQVEDTNKYICFFTEFECGADVSYVIAAETMGGALIPDPPGAPAVTFSAQSANSYEIAFADDFSINQG